MIRQCCTSKSLNGRRNYISSGGLHAGNSVSSFRHLERSRKYSGANLSSGQGYGAAPFGYSVGPVGFGAGIGKNEGFSSQSAGTNSQARAAGNQSSGHHRHEAFSSQSLGGGNSHGRRCRPEDFSSRSLGGCGSRSGLGVNYESLGRFGEGRGIHTVRVNQNLLQPLRIQIDPEISRVKEEEREQIKTLNDKFVSFIDKVKHLEQQNKLLETKWNCLQQQEPVEKANIQPLFENYTTCLKHQLQRLLKEREQLQLEQSKFQDMVEEFKSRYEEEINHRLGAENNFVLLKKDVDVGYSNKVDLEVKVESLRQELNFIRCVFEAEIESLQAANAETSVIVSMDNSRVLDMDGIIHSVRSQYEEIAQKSKDEVNALYENKYKELQNTWGHCCNNLSNGRHEIQDLTRMVQRRKSEVESTKKQIDALQTSIADDEQRGESALKDAKLKLTEVENNLQSSKDELARLLRDYQNLLNLKLPLDIEIAMYKSLLEGEENRISNAPPVNISVIGSSNNSVAGGRSYGGTIGRRQRSLNSSGRSSSRSGDHGSKPALTPRSGDSLSKSSISSGFGQSGSPTAVPSTSKNSDLANVGSPGSGLYGSKSRGYSSTNTTHISATTGVSSKGGSGGISVSGSYNIQSSGGYSGDDYSSRY
ncbi:keratin, type II cytoskeletal 7-like [Pantherophis guttatus]|uniref:Keratin, type II cytoskeletal 7-like n=1 Tax=Pantherophis guttatus TaxID=94885 RepID=A0A6P9BCG5_PANGU|nr:keratin, type II cytoskeletal 7-like [Pantherophis guttatus]